MLIRLPMITHGSRKWLPMGKLWVPMGTGGQGTESWHVCLKAGYRADTLGNVGNIETVSKSCQEKSNYVENQKPKCLYVEEKMSKFCIFGKKFWGKVVSVPWDHKLQTPRPDFLISAKFSLGACPKFRLSFYEITILALKDRTQKSPDLLVSVVQKIYISLNLLFLQK